MIRREYTIEATEEGQIMDEKTRAISEKVGSEFSLRVAAKAEEFRMRETTAQLSIDSIEDMWGSLKQETESILEDFYNEMTNSISQQEMVKKKRTN